jgi:hypothetical protein
VTPEKKIGITFLALVVAYYGSYCIVRNNREVIWRNGSFRIASLHNASVSDNALFNFYRPLIALDEWSMDDSEVGAKPE